MKMSYLSFVHCVRIKKKQVEDLIVQLGLRMTRVKIQKENKITTTTENKSNTSSRKLI